MTLSDQAKSLLLRLYQIKQDKYEEVKTFLLSELRLPPVQFKDRFERATRSSDETYTMFCSRLRNLLTFVEVEMSRKTMISYALC